MLKPRFDFIVLAFPGAQPLTLQGGSSHVELFIGLTANLESFKEQLFHCLSPEEKVKAGKYRFDSDRDLYVLSHSLLRIELASMLKTNPTKISIIQNDREKPFVYGNPVYFNLSHTNGAFSFALSISEPVGVDIEKVVPAIDFKSVSKSVFTPEEIEYIFSSNDGIDTRFFLLWTRKEAFVKAVGAGISENINRFGVSNAFNYADRGIFENVAPDKYSNSYYINSAHTGDYCISLATQSNPEIKLNFLDNNRVAAHFDKLQPYAIS
jgi:phosphopantetheine--protein transferase-like protein